MMQRITQHIPLGKERQQFVKQVDCALREDAGKSLHLLPVFQQQYTGRRLLLYQEPRKKVLDTAKEHAEKGQVELAAVHVIAAGRRIRFSEKREIMTEAYKNRIHQLEADKQRLEEEIKNEKTGMSERKLIPSRINENLRLSSEARERLLRYSVRGYLKVA